MKNGSVCANSYCMKPNAGPKARKARRGASELVTFIRDTRHLLVMDPSCNLVELFQPGK
jgi:hypothetical protein